MSDPRKLVEIKEYCSLLDDKDEVQRMSTEIAAQSAAELADNLSLTLTVLLKKDGVNLASQPFNKHFAAYLKANITSLLSGVATYVDSLVAANKADAETEAGLLGMTTAPTTIPAPAITSASTVTATIGDSFSYDIVASDTSGPGITSCVYSATGLASWMSLDASTGAITGAVPTTATDGDSFTMTVTVTTNGGTDSQTVTVTLSV